MNTSTLTCGAIISAAHKLSVCKPGAAAPQRDREFLAVECAASACRAARLVLSAQSNQADRAALGGALADVLVDALRLARMNNVNPGCLKEKESTIEEVQAAAQCEIFADPYDPVAPAMYLVAAYGPLCTGMTCQSPVNTVQVTFLLEVFISTAMLIANLTGVALEKHLPAALAARGASLEAT